MSTSASEGRESSIAFNCVSRRRHGFLKGGPGAVSEGIDMQVVKLTDNVSDTAENDHILAIDVS